MRNLKFNLQLKIWRHRKAIIHIGFALLWVILWVVVAKFIWLRDGNFLAIGDFGPLLGSEKYSWYRVVDLINAGQITYQNTIRFFPYFAFHIITDLLRISYTNAEVLWLGINFALPGITMFYYLRQAFKNQSIIYILAGALSYNLNFIVINNILIVRPIWTLYYLLPLCFLAIDRIFIEVFDRKQEKLSPATLAIATIALTSLTSILINPPTLFVGLISIVIYLVFKYKKYPFLGRAVSILRLGRAVTKLLVLFLIINLWLIFPFVNNLFNSSTNIGKDVVNLSFVDWSSENTVIQNLLVGKGNYFWGRSSIGDTPYFVYADTYETPGFEIILFGLTAFAILGLLNKKDLSLFALTLMALALFLAKGIQDPFGGINRWLFENAPLFWLLRSPFFKTIILFFFALTILYINTIVFLSRKHKYLASIGVIFIIVASLLISFPLFNGQIFPAERGQLPGAQVTIPDYWFQMSSEINNSPAVKRVLIYPQNPFYQVHYNWDGDGYHAVDIAERIITKEVITSTTDGVYLENPRITELVNQIYASPQDKELLKLMGITHILDRNDLDYTHYNRYSNIKPNLEQLGYKKVASYGELDLYEVASTKSITITTNIVESNRFNSEVYQYLAAIYPDFGMISTTADYDLTEGFDLTDFGNGNIYSNLTKKTNLYSLQDSKALLYRLDTEQRSVLIQSEIENNKGRLKLNTFGEDILVNKAELNIPDLSQVLNFEFEDNSVLELNGEAKLINFNNDVWTDLSIMPLKQKNDVQYYLKNKSPTQITAKGELGNCFNPEKLSLEEAGISYNKIAENTYSLNATKGKACAKFSLRELPVSDLLTIKFKANNNYGNIMEFCLLDENTRDCVVSRTVGFRDKYENVEIHYKPESKDQKLSIYLYTPTSGNIPSANIITDLNALSLTKQNSQKLIGEFDSAEKNLFANYSTLDIKNITEGVNTLELELKNVKLQKSLTFEEAGYQANSITDCRRSDDRSLEELGISGELVSEIEPGDLGMKLSAREHIGCFRLSLGNLSTLKDYLLEFQGINLEGRAGYSCLKAANRPYCEKLNFENDGELDSMLRNFKTIFTPKVDAEYFIYFYSNADYRTSINYYDDIKIYEMPRSYSSSLLLLLYPDKLSQDTQVNYETVIDSFFLKSIAINQTLDRPTLITDKNGYDKGWTAFIFKSNSLIPSQINDHIVTNGYANGWIIKESKSAAIVIIIHIPQLITFVLIGLPISVLATLLLIKSIKVLRNAIKRKV